jgi:hypothetical protein
MMADEGRYRVSWSRKAVAALKAIRDREGDAGRRAELARAVRAIDERLRSDARTLGEVYRSRGAVEEYLAIHGFLAVDFAVDVARRFVLVRSCHTLSGYGS